MRTMQRVQFRLSTLLLGLVIVGQLCTFAAAWLQRPRPEPIVLGPPLAGGLVLWVPRCRGDYPVELAAIGEDGGYTVQAFVVHVR